MESVKGTQEPSAVGFNLASADGFFARFRVKIDASLLDLALTHRSWAAEHNRGLHNERLEFLGDSVLGFIVAEKLYKRYGDLRESELTKRRAAVVSTVALAKAGRRIGLGEFIKLGRGEARDGGSAKQSILADTVEAVIAAVYLSTEIATATRFVLQILEPEFEVLESGGYDFDPKTTLQELSGAESRPEYVIVREDGPSHARVFTAQVSVCGVTAVGTATSKKGAELAAAAAALEVLSDRPTKSNSHRRGIV